jgi:hypothetical protein
MSRFSGPQDRGAARTLHAARRLEAETRQAAEAEREAARVAAFPPECPLTVEELTVLGEAALLLIRKGRI